LEAKPEASADSNQAEKKVNPIFRETKSGAVKLKESKIPKLKGRG
jgi:hypothetical protein